MCLKSLLEPMRFVGTEYELVWIHGNKIQPILFEISCVPDPKVMRLESRISSSCTCRAAGGTRPLFWCDGHNLS